MELGFVFFALVFFIYGGSAYVEESIWIGLGKSPSRRASVQITRKSAKYFGAYMMICTSVIIVPSLLKILGIHISQDIYPWFSILGFCALIMGTIVVYTFKTAIILGEKIKRLVDDFDHTDPK